MYSVELPISKSIANRLLILQAIHRDEHGGTLMPVSCAMPDDVRLMHSVLNDAATIAEQQKTYDLGNCGTAMRFLIAYFAQREGCDVVLTGCERMQERPIGQLVDVLRQMGAAIDYTGKEGYPPLHIKGKRLQRGQVVYIAKPASTQFVSALLLIGVEVTTDSLSPYIAMTKALLESVNQSEIERDWSAAAFWYEYVALHDAELRLTGLRKSALQGDNIAADIYARLGVETEYDAEGVVLRKKHAYVRAERIELDFSACPDLYPSVAICCEVLGVQLVARGTESLHLKESDRIEAVAHHEVRGDHRMAMALLAADLPCDDIGCISKSYPAFYAQWQEINNLQTRSSLSHITPRRGINDDRRGKKYALRKLIQAAATEWVWLHDDDVRLPVASDEEALREIGNADMLILPLRMRTEHKPNLLERLQIAEYAAIQQLTIETARRGHAVMCSGANLMVRRSSWLAAYEDIHPEIPSGDDMFMLEAMKHRGMTVRVSANPRMEAAVQPEKTWRGLFRQRMRWAGKSPAYRDKDILRCGALVLAANLLQALCPLLIIIKFPIDYTLILRREPSVSVWTALLLGLLYPYYMLLCLLGGVARYLFSHRRSTDSSF
ncbi:MAG: glycosyltransferase family 2 protein [Paludibacteraceae bacterium]